MLDGDKQFLANFITSVDNHPDASKDAIFKAFPQLKNDDDLLQQAMNFRTTYKAHPDMDEATMQRLFPQLLGVDTLTENILQTEAKKQEIHDKRDLGYLQRKEEERKEAAVKHKRQDSATLPLSEEEAKNEARISLLEMGEVPSVYRPTVDENGKISVRTETTHVGGEEAQKKLDELKSNRPEYLSRGNNSDKDILNNVIEAHTANTEAGKKAMEAFDKAAEAIDKDIEKDYNSYLDGLQKQVNEEKLTVDAANKLLEQKKEELKELSNSLKGDKYTELVVNPAIDANEDYIKKMDVNLTNATIDATSAELTRQIDKRYAEEQEKRKSGNEAFDLMNASMGGRFTVSAATNLYEQNILLDDARELLKDANTIKKAAVDKEGFWKAMGNTTGDTDTWDLGIGQLRRTSEWKRIVEKYQASGNDESKLTEDERIYMKSMLTYLASCASNSDRLSSYYKMGQSTAESIPFMLQFLMMPVSGIESGVVKGLVNLGKSLFPNVAVRVAGSAFTKALAMTGASLIGTAVAAGAQTLAFGVPKIIEGSLDRQMGDVQYKRNDVDKAFEFGGIREGSKQSKTSATLNSIWDNYVENLSEIAFDSLIPLGEYFSQSFLKPTLRMFNAIGLEEFPRSIIRFNNNSVIKALRKDVRLGGIIEEGLEEELGSLLRLMCSDVNSLEDAGFTAEQQKEMILGLIPMQVAFGFMGGVHYIARSARERRDYKDFRASLDNDTQRMLFDKMMSASKHGEFGNATYDLMRDIISDPYASQEKKVEKMEKVLATYKSKLSLEVRQAADNYIEETYSVAAKSKAEKLANESVKKGEEQYIYLTKDEKGRDIAIKGGNVALVNHTVDGVTYTVLNPTTSDKKLVVGFPQEIVKEEKPKLRRVETGKLSAPVVKMTIGEYMDFVLDAKKAEFLGEGSFEHDGKFYDVETMEEVTPQQEQSSAVSEENLPEPITDNKDVPFTLGEGESVSYTDKKGQVHQMTAPIFKSGEYYVMDDGTLYVKDGGKFSIREAEGGVPLTKKEKRSALDSINELIKKRAAQAKINAANAAQAAANKKAEDEAAAKAKAGKDAKMKELAAQATKKNGELDDANGTPEQIVCYLLTHVEQSKALDYIKRYITNLVTERAKATDALKEFKLDQRIEAFYAAVGEWVSPDVEALMRDTVAKETTPQIETPTPAAPVVEEKPEVKQETPKEEPKERKEKKPKESKTPEQPKQEAPAQPVAEQPIEPEPDKREPKLRKAPGFEEGMDVKDDNVWLVHENKHNYKLVKSAERPENAVGKEFVYFDEGRNGPYLLWPAKGERGGSMLSKSRDKRKYIDRDGNVKDAFSTTLVMENPDKIEGAPKFVPVLSPKRLHVTKFDTILNTPINIEGEEYKLNDILNASPVGTTVAKGGEGKNFLSGYQVIEQKIKERSDLTDEQIVRAIESLQEQTRKLVALWNSFAKNSLGNVSLKKEQLMQGYAMKLSIFRSTRDGLAENGNTKEVENIQKNNILQFGVEKTQTGEYLPFTVSTGDANSFTLSTFRNPLYQMALMLKVAKDAGAIEYDFDIILPDHLDRIANSTVVEPNDIDKARKKYAEKKANKQSTKELEYEFPEVRNSLPALVRFAQPKNEKGKRAQSNKWYDKSLADVYKKMDAALKRAEEEKKSGEALVEFKKLLSQAYVIATQEQVDEQAMAAMNEAIAAELDKHADNPAYQKAYDQTQKQITKHVNSLEKNREAVRRANILQERRDLESEKVRYQDTIKAIDEANKERKKKGMTVSGNTVKNETNARIAELNKQIAVLEKENPWLADEFRLEQEVAVLQELNKQLEKQNKIMDDIRANRVEHPVEADRNAEREQNNILTELLEQISDYEAEHPEARDRFYKIWNDANKKGLSLEVQPELSIADEQGVPMRTPHTRLALRALSRVLGWAGIQLHYAGNQEQARERLAQLQGTPELERIESPKGILLGWAIGNEIYLTDEGMNSETPIHEYTHLWVRALRRDNKEAWDAIVALCKKNKRLWDEVKNDPNYANIKDDPDAIASEMLARYSGKNGMKRLEEMARKIAEKGGVKSDKLVTNLINNMRSALQEFWRVIKNLLHIDNNVTLDEVADLVLKDLFDGKPLNLNTEEMQAIKDKADADGTFMKAPNGNASKLTERQWLIVRTKAFKEWYGDWENPEDGEFFLLDENGEPMVVYHGTEEAGFDIFVPQENGERNGRGIFMTPQRFVAGVYGKLTGEENGEFEATIGEDPRRGIYSLFTNIKNPLIIDCFDPDTQRPSMWNAIPTGIWKIVGKDMETQYYSSYEDAVEAYYEQGWGVGTEGTDLEEPEIVPETHTTDEFVDLARSQGYDGVIFKNIIDGTDSALLEDMEENDLYMRAHDVVTALAPNQVKSATQNNGLFSMEDARIEFSVAEQQNQNSDDVVIAEKAEAVKNAEDVLTRPGMNDMQRRDELMDWVTKALDQTNGIRIIMNSINAFRKVMGKGKIPGKLDVRTIFESARAKGNNQYVAYQFGLKKEFDGVIREWGSAISKLDFFKENREEKGGENRAKLTPQQFLERYLLAKNDIERAKEGVARGLETFAERMGMTVEEFVEQFEKQFPKSEIDKLWAEIKKMTDFALKIQLDGHILTQEEYDDYVSRKYYVPQRGFWDDVNPENDNEKSEESRRPGKRRMRTSGMRKAKGGESLAAGCLAYIYRDVIESIEKANSNMVKKAMFDLLRDNADWCRAVGFPIPQEIDFTIIDGKVVKMVDGLTKVDIQQMYKEIRENTAKIEANEKEIESLREQEQTEDVINRIIELRDENTRLEEAVIKNRETLPDVQARRRDIYGQAKHSYDDQNGDPHIVPLCVNGIATFIQFPEKHILTAAALNGNRDTRGEVKALRPITSWLSTKFTVQNPVFFSTNIVRDYPFVMQKGLAEYGPLFGPTFFHYWNTSHAAVWEYLLTHKVPDSDAGAQLQDFLDKGGNTGFSLDEDIQSWRDHVQDLNPGMTWQKVLSGTGTAIDWITLAPVAEVLNEWSEIVTRFAAYRAVVKLGYGVNEGIKAAHNLSTNFNRKGLGLPLLNFFNSLTVFSNAAIQGASGLWRTFGSGDSSKEWIKHYEGLKTLTSDASEIAVIDQKISELKSMKKEAAWDLTKRVAGTMTWVIFVPALLGFIDTLCNPDDDNNEYAVSEYDRANYIILGKGRIALSQELKPWWNIGVQAALLMRGRKTQKEAVNAFLTSLVENTLPAPQNIVDLAKMGVDTFTGENRPDLVTGFSQGVARIFMPAALDPFTQVAENRNFMGGKIRYDFGDMPEYKTTPSEAALFQDLAYAWYRLGGGSKYVDSLTKDNGDELSAAFNVNPKQIRSMMFMVPSGVLDLACLSYGFWKDTYNRLTDQYEETSIRSKDVPIFNRFYREDNPSLYRYGIIKEARGMVKSWNDKIKNAENEVIKYNALASEAKNDSDYQKYMTSAEEAERRLEDLYSDDVMWNISDLVDTYSDASIRSVAGSLGLNEKEYKKAFPDSSDVLNESEKDIVKELLSGIILKKGLRYDKDNPAVVRWIDDRTGFNPEREE